MEMIGPNDLSVSAWESLEEDARVTAALLAYENLTVVQFYLIEDDDRVGYYYE